MSQPKPWWRTQAEYQAHQVRLQLRVFRAEQAAYEEWAAAYAQVAKQYGDGGAKLEAELKLLAQKHRQEMIAKGLAPADMIDPLRS